MDTKKPTHIGEIIRDLIPNVITLKNRVDELEKRVEKLEAKIKGKQ